MDANDLLMSGGIKSISWKDNPVGYTAVGTITDPPKAEQMKKYQSEELDFWPSGDPKMQIIVTIQTDLRDPADPHDDGRRRLHIPPRMMTPVREAVRRAGAPGLEVGGRIAVRRTGGSGATGDPFTFAADYGRPVMDPGSLLGPDTAPVVSAASGQPVVHQQQVPPAPAASPTLASLANAMQAAQAAPAMPPAPAGVDPTVWAALPDTQRAAILAAMAPGTAPTSQAIPY